MREIIKKCEYKLSESDLEPVSENARDFLSKLLVHAPDQRLSATEALQHDWISQK
jgi:serine/threonine protein kinase